MDIYQDKQVFDRTPGAVGAASDGMAPGQAYPAVVKTNTNSKGYCEVIIPALHLSYSFQAKTVSTVGVGTNVLVIFDQEKIPWVVTPTAGTPAVAMAYRSAAQTGIKNNTETRVQLDTIIKDPGNNFNVTAGNGFYTVPAEGYYHIDGAVNLTTTEATYSLIPYIRINGSPIPLRGAEAARHPGGGTSEITQVTGIVFLKAGDKVELMVYQTSGTDKEIPTANEGYTRMSIMRVGEAGPAGATGPPGPVSAEFVSALPSSPTDGKEIFFDTGTGIVWHLRYNLGLGGAYKWQYLGGSPLGFYAGAEITTKAKEEKAYTGSVVVPLSGEYNLSGYNVMVLLKAESSEAATMLGKNGASTGVALLVFTNSIAFSRVEAGFISVSIAATKGDTLTLRANQTTAAGEWLFGGAPRLLLTPIAVG